MQYFTAKKTTTVSYGTIDSISGHNECSYEGKVVNASDIRRRHYRHPQERALCLTDARNDWDLDTCTTVVVDVGEGVGMQLLYIPLGKEETCSRWVKG
jgi:hypothetical protein